ncbi:MAG TPA: tetratricopeptide repeat protein [Bacteroidia bacterium]|nr:tetratricopeptide repeat protein [Bacteroidia bacterium]
MRISLVHSFILFIALFISSTYHAQKNADDKFAMLYLDKKEYEKANVYLEKLYDKNPDQWYSYYFTGLMGVKDYKEAEKISKKMLKRNPQSVNIYINIAKIYREQGDTKKENENYQKAIKEVIPIQSFIQLLAVEFMEEKLYDLAIETYLKGRKQTPEYPYYYEIAEVYKRKGDLKSMINQYLDAIDFRESELYTAQGYLQNALGYEEESAGFKNPILKQELQKRIQQHPDKIVFAEFLIFIQKQQKDFEGAFTQSKSLDKRLKEDGHRMFELAKLCLSNEKYEVAQKCFQYIIDKGPSYGFYDAACIDIINCEYQYLTGKAQPSTTELLALENKFLKATEKYKSSHLANFLISNLANLQAYYLNKPDSAIMHIEGLLQNPAMDAQTRAEFKIQLADIYLLKNVIWDASLLYSQVEKDFKFEPIGQEAKFRNAKLSFYAADFTWAKTQCDVLKGSTTKLIANDALDLSLIITDAIGVDTNAAPLARFAVADLLIVQHKYDEAIVQLDSINKIFPTHTLGDDILFKKAAIYDKLGKYPEAEKMYKDIIEYYSTELYGDDAQFKLAELYEKKMIDVEKAKTEYQNVLTKYPGSIYVVEARKRYRQLRGDNLDNG